MPLGKPVLHQRMASARLSEKKNSERQFYVGYLHNNTTKKDMKKDTTWPRLIWLFTFERTAMSRQETTYCYGTKTHIFKCIIMSLWWIQPQQCPSSEQRLLRFEEQVIKKTALLLPSVWSCFTLPLLLFSELPELKFSLKFSTGAVLNMLALVYACRLSCASRASRKTLQTTSGDKKYLFLFCPLLIQSFR